MKFLEFLEKLKELMQEKGLVRVKNVSNIKNLIRIKLMDLVVLIDLEKTLEEHTNIHSVFQDRIWKKLLSTRFRNKGKMILSLDLINITYKLNLAPVKNTEQDTH